MNYDLKKSKKNIGFLKTLKGLSPYFDNQKLKLLIAIISILISSAATIASPFIIGDAVDTYIAQKDSENLIRSVILLIIIYIVSFITSYIQIYFMGNIGQEVLFKVRNKLFKKIQSLPIAFFNKNKSGDLISRINSDTDKLNQTFSETIIRFIGNIVVIIGIGIMMLVLNFKLALVALISTFGLIIFTSIVSPWIKNQNKIALEKIGNLSGEVQESLDNFKVIITYDRRDYFRKKFDEVNEKTRKASIKSNIANGILRPIYYFAGNIALLLVLIFGIQMLINGNITIGLLITFISYTERFYQPLRILANLYASLQTAIASWSRISQILQLETNLKIIKTNKNKNSDLAIEFDDVTFRYSDSENIIENVNIEMREGKTYAFVGPTGGGKTTTASLIARLFDTSEGNIYIYGKNVKTILRRDMSSKIGFILQEPYLFSGTIGENIRYGNDKLINKSDNELAILIKEIKLESIINKFKDGLKTKISGEQNTISLGQKQLIAFLRVILRKPKILILDEATANVDTVTESLLQTMLDKLPKNTTKIIIAHRLNTIKEADEIFFISGSKIEPAGSFEEAIEKIENTEIKS